MTRSPRGFDPAIRLLRGLSPLAARGSSKLARGIRGRVGAAERLATWGRKERDRGRPLLWLHAPSVGEGLQARAVLRALDPLLPSLQSVFTHFSPSAERFAAGFPASVSDYLPWDVRAELELLLEALDPTVIAFTKTEVWPGLAAAAGARGIPVVLLAATLPAESKRLRPLGRALLASTFSSLERVLAISEEDGHRFRRLGVRPDRIEVTGDPGIDSAWERAVGVEGAASYLAPLQADPRPTLVVGSSWPSDERHLLPALIQVREGFPELRVVVAPHEPHEIDLARLESTFGKSGFRSRRLGQVEELGTVEGVDLVLVDRVGVLAALYTIGTIAYVGGGFGRDGLHSVLEPAAAGLPVLFGPRHGNARAAGELLRLGGGVSIGSAEALGTAIMGWLADPHRRAEAAARAQAFIKGHRGAAGRTAAVLEGMLGAG